MSILPKNSGEKRQESYMSNMLDARRNELTALGRELVIRRSSGIPHCDHRILHIPGTCEFCDHYPDWQLARMIQGINFTGETYDDLAPDPATFARPIDIIELWDGNRHENENTKKQRDEYWQEVEAKLGRVTK